jgi:outer membrane protein assembly factor BamB
VIGLAILCLLLAQSLPETDPRPAGSDWPRFLGPHGNATTPESLPSPPWPESGPRLLWQAEVGDGYSMPAIAGGRLFLFDRRGDRARLSCRDASTGRELWLSDYPTDYEDVYGFSNGPRSTPFVDGKRVYSLGVEGRLRCHAVSDGKLLWDVDTAGRFGVVQNFFGVGSSPVVEGDLLLVPVGGSSTDAPPIHSGMLRGNGSGIVAFDKRTGEVRYAVTDELAGYSTPVFATIGERRWGFVFARGGLVGFEPASGSVDFHYPWRARKLESVNAANPVVVADTVLVSESYGPGSSLVRVRPGGYEVLWKDDPAGPSSLRSHWATPVHHRGTVFGCSGSGIGDAELRAIEHASGKVVWRKKGLGRSTLILAGDQLLVLTEYGRLIVVKAGGTDYEPVAEVDLGTPGNGGSRPAIEPPAWNAPALARGRIYVRGKKRLLCLQLGGG